MEQFILSDEQIVMLNFIYGKRRNLIIAVACSLPILIYKGQRNDEYGNTYLYKMVYLFLILVILVVLIFLFFFRLNPIRKDIKGKSGIYLFKTIERKDSFPFVGKYFFFFDDEKLPSKEVTESEYQQFNVGDTYAVPYAANSGIVVDGFMNYKLL